MSGGAADSPPPPPPNQHTQNPSTQSAGYMEPVFSRAHLKRTTNLRQTRIDVVLHAHHSIETKQSKQSANNKLKKTPVAEPVQMRLCTHHAPHVHAAVDAVAAEDLRESSLRCWGELRALQRKNNTLQNEKGSTITNGSQRLYRASHRDKTYLAATGEKGRRWWDEQQDKTSSHTICYKTSP